MISQLLTHYHCYCEPPLSAKPNPATPQTEQRTMTDTLPDAAGVQEEVKTMDNDAKDDMFVSAMSDSPTDSGLETNKTSNSDTMEDLSLQVRMRMTVF